MQKNLVTSNRGQQNKIEKQYLKNKGTMMLNPFKTYTSLILISGWGFRDVATQINKYSVVEVELQVTRK